MNNDIRWTLRFRKGHYERKWCRTLPWYHYNLVYFPFYTVATVIAWLEEVFIKNNSKDFVLRNLLYGSAIGYAIICFTVTLILPAPVAHDLTSPDRKNDQENVPGDEPSTQLPDAGKLTCLEENNVNQFSSPSTTASSPTSNKMKNRNTGETIAYIYFCSHLATATILGWCVIATIGVGRADGLSLVIRHLVSVIVVPWICLTLLYQPKVAVIWPLYAIALTSVIGSLAIVATIPLHPVPSSGTSSSTTSPAQSSSVDIDTWDLVLSGLEFCALITGFYALRYAREYYERMAFLHRIQTERRLTVLHQTVIRLSPVRGDGSNVHGESTLEEMLSLLKQTRNLLTVANSKTQNTETMQAMELIKEVVKTMSIGGDLFKVRFANIGEEGESIIDQYVRGGSHAPTRKSGRRSPTEFAPITEDEAQTVSQSRYRRDMGTSPHASKAFQSNWAPTKSSVPGGALPPARVPEMSHCVQQAAVKESDIMTNSFAATSTNVANNRSPDTKQARQAVLNTRRMRNTNVLFDCYCPQGASGPGAPGGADSYVSVPASLGPPSGLRDIAFSEMDERVGLDWSLDIFRFTESAPDVLVQFGAAMLIHYCGFLGISVDGLLGFLGAVQECYWDNAYHNRIHAASVAHATACFSNMLGLTRAASAFTELTEVVCVTASLGHDVGHPSRTNQFFVITHDPLAVIYNDVSVLENYHAFLTFQILDNGPCDIFGQLTVTVYREARRRIIEIILATDMKEHFESISKFRIRRCAPDFVCRENPDDLWHCLKIVVKAADLSHGCVEWSQHFLWSCLIQEEFYQQGEEEKSLGQPISPLCDRESHQSFAKSQKGFLEFVVAPLFTELRELAPTSKIGICLENLWINKEHWTQIEARGEYVEFPNYVKRYQEKRRAELRSGGGLKAMWLYVTRLAAEHSQAQSSRNTIGPIVLEGSDSLTAASNESGNDRENRGGSNSIGTDSTPSVKIRAVRWA